MSSELGKSVITRREAYAAADDLELTRLVRAISAPFKTSSHHHLDSGAETLRFFHRLFILPDETRYVELLR